MLAWQYVVFMYSGLFRVLYCVGFGLVPHTALCLIGWCSGSYWEELVTSQWQAAFVCRNGKKEMALNEPEVVICCWQTDAVLSGGALSYHCGLTAGFHPSVLQICAQCKLLLNVIHALKLFVTIMLWWRLRIKIPLQHRFWSTEWESIS